MKKDTIVYCPACEGEGRVMEGKLYPSGHTEVYLTCHYCDGSGEITYEYGKELSYNDSELKEVDGIIENFEIY